MKKSAGLLLYRINKNEPEVLLVHPGGPFWRNRDLGAWSIPKGEFDIDEDPLTAAKREVKEELGVTCRGPFIELPAIRQKSGKLIFAWAVKKEVDAAKISSNHFELEWPPKSGRYESFPEVDKAEWFSIPAAKEKIIEAQIKLIESFCERLFPEQR